MQGGGGLKIGDATSTKQNLGRVRRQPMVVASSTTGATITTSSTPRGQEKLFPKGAPIGNAGF